MRSKPKRRWTSRARYMASFSLWQGVCRWSQAGLDAGAWTNREGRPTPLLIQLQHQVLDNRLYGIKRPGCQPACHIGLLTEEGYVVSGYNPVSAIIGSPLPTTARRAWCTAWVRPVILNTRLQHQTKKKKKKQNQPQKHQKKKKSKHDQVGIAALHRSLV